MAVASASNTASQAQIPALTAPRGDRGGALTRR